MATLQVGVDPPPFGGVTASVQRPEISEKPELHRQIPLIQVEFGFLKHRSQKVEFTARPWHTH